MLVVIRPFGGALVAKQQHVIDQWCKAVGVPDHEEPTDDVTVVTCIGQSNCLVVDELNCVAVIRNEIADV